MFYSIISIVGGLIIGIGMAFVAVSGMVAAMFPKEESGKSAQDTSRQSIGMFIASLIFGLISAVAFYAAGWNLLRLV